MNRIQIHSKKFSDNRAILLTSKILFALTLFIILGLPNSGRAYEWDRKALEEAGNMDFPKQKAFTPFSYNQLQKKGYIFGIKMDFEVNTIWSTSKNKLKSEQLSHKFIGEDYFSDGNDFSNELPLASEMSIGAKPAKLLEVRF